MSHEEWNRREFLRAAALGAAAVGGAAALGGPAAHAGQDRTGEGIKLGLTSYSLRKIKLEPALEIVRRVGLTRIALKSMHMSLRLSPDRVRAIAKQVRDAGLDLYGAGVIYMSNPAQVDQAFAYARAAGLRVIIGVPAHGMLGVVEKKVKQTDIPVAIHNHGPGDKRYPTPESVYTRVKNMDPRMGLCIDIGHTQRHGIDPAGEILKYGDRLLDLHMKDVTKAEKDGKELEIGRGVIDIPKVLRALIRVKFAGVAAIEYEKDPADPLAGLAESAGFLRGAMRAIRSQRD